MTVPSKILTEDIVPPLAQNVQALLGTFADKIGIEFAGVLQSPNGQFSVTPENNILLPNAITLDAGNYMVIYSTSMRVVSNSFGTQIRPFLWYGSYPGGSGTILYPPNMNEPTYATYASIGLISTVRETSLGLGISQSSSTTNVTCSLIKAAIFRLKAA